MLGFWRMDGRVSGEMGEKSRTNMTHHRSNLLLGMQVVSGCRLQGRQLSLILPVTVYEEWTETPSEFVTDQGDGRPSVMVGKLRRLTAATNVDHPREGTAGG